MGKMAIGEKSKWKKLRNLTNKMREVMNKRKMIS